MSIVNEKETVDEVVQEVRRIKEALAEQQGYDIDRILDDARRKQEKSGHTILLAPARRDA